MAISPQRLAEQLAELNEDQRNVFINKLPPAASERVKELLSDLATQNAQEGASVDLLPHQRIPPPDQIVKGHVFGGGRGAGKTLALANYISRVAESTPGLRARVIAPTLSDAVNSTALDPQSGILAHSPSATFKSSGIEGARILWPNGSVCYLVGTPTLKDVDRLRALTNIDLDAIEEAAANPRLTEAMQQADLSRRGNRLHHPIWVAATTPRPVPLYKKWMNDPGVSVTHAGTADNPYTPEAYREYAESLKGTHLYDQEVLGLVVEDIQGALWKSTDVQRSLVEDPTERANLMAIIDSVVIGVDPPSGHGTCGIVVVGRTRREDDPTEHSRIVILDDFSVSEASPATWGRRVIEAAQAYGGTVVAERNQGGLMVESTIRQAAEAAGEDFMPVTLAHAAVSKERRAAPVALLWEVDPQRGLIAPPHGELSRVATLMDQFTSWVPKAFSPDNLDAAVWGANYLMTGASTASARLQPPRSKRITRGHAFRNALMGRR